VSPSPKPPGRCRRIRGTVISESHGACVAADSGRRDGPVVASRMASSIWSQDRVAAVLSAVGKSANSMPPPGVAFLFAAEAEVMETSHRLWR